MNVGDMIKLLQRYDDDLEVVLVEHPYRGSTILLDFDEHDTIEVEDDLNYDAEEDHMPTETIVAIQVGEYPGDFTPAEGQEWPGRSR